MTTAEEPLTLTEPEEALIRLLRAHVAEIEALVDQSEAERALWEAEHPGEFYAALNEEGSAGAKAYAQCAEACAEMALAGFSLAARTLGITGWQGSWAELEFLRRSRGMEVFSVVDFADALYPQYDVLGRIEERLSAPETVKWLGDCAEYALADKSGAAPQVREHWERLVAARDALVTV